MLRLIISVPLLLLCSLNLLAQNEIQEDSLTELSIEQLMNIRISVASKKEMSIRETPGIVTLITEEDIKNIGARDLIDVLRFVPGLDFGSDVLNSVGLGVRGNWASEGKASIIVDGIETNELLYANSPYGTHFSVDNIKRIEIIRGPGSALYGGTSELAVINIITKQHEQEGTKITAMYGQMRDGFGRMQMTANMGNTIGGWKIHFGAFLAEANRSDGRQIDFYSPSNSFSMLGNSLIKNQVFHGGATYGNFSFNFLIDRYNNVTKDGYGSNLPVAINNAFNTSAATLKYAWRISKIVTVTPTYQYRWSQPWGAIDTINIARNLGKVEVSIDPSDNVNMIAGTQFFSDDAKFKGTRTVSLLPPDNTKTTSYQNYAMFFQGIFKTKIANLTAGARYDKNSAGFSAFVPRIGLTKVMGPMHIKLLASEAFRAPYTMDITSHSIRAEKALILEAETGIQLSKFYATLNVFDIKLSDVLIYVNSGNNNIGYTNGSTTGTAGFEADLKYKDSWGYFGLNYSYYQKNEFAKQREYIADKDWFMNPLGSTPSSFIGFAPHKINVMSQFNFTKNVSLNINSNIYSARYGYHSVNEADGVAYLRKYPSLVLLNTFLNCDNVLMKGLSLGLGVYNILNSEVLFLTPYTTFSGQVSSNNVPITYNRAPLPGPSREVVFRLQYVIKSH